MMKDFASKRDVCAGALLLAIGLGAVYEGTRHSIGRLTQMGAGYFPIVLGCVLAGLGLILAIGALAGQQAPKSDDEHFVMPDWRGCAAIVAGVLAFLLVGSRFGLAPAVFLCVIIAAVGDRTTTRREAFVLATAMTVFSVGLFSYVLQIQFPVFHW